MPTEPLVSNKIGQRLGRRGRLTRDRFLDAARVLLATTSPIDLTAAAISKAAGSSPATFYVYFDDVRELLLALSAAAPARVEALFPREDALLVDDRLQADVAVMIAAVNAAWDLNAPILLFRNLEADRGDTRFDTLRTAQARPMLDRIAAAIARRRGPDHDPMAAEAAASVLVAAIERIAVRTHRSIEDGVPFTHLSSALNDFVIRAISMT